MHNEPIYKIKDYDISDFDEEMNLKLGINNILALSFLFHPVFLMAIASSMGGRASASLIKASYASETLMYWALGGVIPAFILLVGFVFPNLSMVSKVVGHGKKIIIVSAFYSCSIWVYVALGAGSKLSILQLSMLLASGFCVVYSFRSKRLCDYFTNFMVNKPDHH